MVAPGYKENQNIVVSTTPTPDTPDPISYGVPIMSRDVDGKAKFVGDENPIPTNILNVLIPNSYDYIFLTYTGDDVTSVVYKQGGSSGEVVATLTLGYTDGNLTSVERS